MSYFLTFFPLPTFLDTMPYTLHVSGGGREKKWGKETSGGAKHLRVAEMMGDVVSRV